MNLSHDRVERHYESYHHNCVVTKPRRFASTLVHSRACATPSYPHVADDNVVIANHAIIIISFIVDACWEKFQGDTRADLIFTPDFFGLESGCVNFDFCLFHVLDHSALCKQGGIYSERRYRFS